MNFIKEFKKGQEGGNKGLSMGKGLEAISTHINGVQRKRYYGVGSPPKVGKSTIVDEGFVIQPWLDALSQDIPIEFIYFSFEMDRVSKEFDFATYFLHYDYGIEKIELPEGITVKGSSIIDLSSEYLRGRVIDDEGNTVKVSTEIEDKLKNVYYNRIVPLFGEWSDTGVLIRQGYIIFIEKRENPRGIYKYLVKHAEKYGKVVRTANGTMIGYTRTSEFNKFTIVIIDHMRKVIKEQGFSLKETVDKMSEYCVELRNYCDFTLVGIIHTNRNIDPGGYRGDMEIYPTGDHIKESGNMSEDVDYMFTLMDPNDDKYNIKKHFNLTIRDSRGKILYPNLRSVHLVESRHVPFPRHFSLIMRGNLKKFEKLKIRENYD